MDCPIDNDEHIEWNDGLEGTEIKENDNESNEQEDSE